jgi:hypothetical protein
VRSVFVRGLELRLTDEDAEDLRRQLGVEVTDGPLDVAGAARVLGCSKDHVYANAVKLGGWKLSDGPKGRWRFDVSRLRQVRPDPGPRSEVAKPTRRKRRAPTGRQKPDLLEVRGPGPARTNGIGGGG